MIPKYRYDFKLMIAGEPGSGKTCFVDKLTKDIFKEEYKPTKKSGFGFKIYKKDGKLYRIEFWDLAGEDKEHVLAKIFSNGAHGCVYMSDATNKQTREK